MLAKNSDAIMEMLKASDLVFDIGGWAHPFNRANYVMDAEPYETRGYYNRTFARNSPYPPIGGTVEHFTERTWIRRDICEKTPFPFRDKELDYVICSHSGGRPRSALGLLRNGADWEERLHRGSLARG